MAGVKLDGAGIQKMKTIDEANILVARLHAIVELYALSLKQNKPTSLFGSQIKRALFYKKLKILIDSLNLISLSFDLLVACV